MSVPTLQQIAAAFSRTQAARIHSAPNVFYIFSTCCCLLMAGVDALAGETNYSLFLFSSAMLALIMLAIGIRTNHHPVVNSISVGGATLFGLILLALGGVENNGHLWVFMLPAMVMFTFGFTNGVVCTLALLLASYALLFIPDFFLLQTTYPTSFKIRFPIALLFAGVFAGIAEYARANKHIAMQKITEELHRSACTDLPTGIANRLGMGRLLEKEHHRAQRTGRTYSIVLCEIDSFKRINEQFGQKCGDFLLRQLANEIGSVLRKQDFISRWEGHEFLILLPETDHKGAMFAAERIRKAICKQSYRYEGYPVKFTASLGVTPEFLDSPEDNIRVAYEKLHEARHKGRNCVVGETTICSLPLSNTA